MANKKIQATAQLFLNTKDAQKDAQKFVEDLKQRLSDIESAADKMTVFKDMVEYIAQVDKAMANLKENNKDVFGHMFDGIDANLKVQLESLFGVSGEQLGKIDVLREKLKTLTPKSSIKELRGFAEEINNIFTSLGVSTPFNNIAEQFSGKTNTGHIELLTDALANLATVWQDINFKIANGFGVGGAGGGLISPKIQGEIDNLEQRIKHYESVMNKFNTVAAMKKTADDFEPIDLDFEVSEKAVDGLIDKYNELQNVLDTVDSDSIEYSDALAERAKVAMQLIELNNQLMQEGPEKKRLQQFIWDEGVEEYPLEDFAYEFEDQMKHINKLISDTRNEINSLKQSAIMDTTGSDSGFEKQLNSIDDAADQAGDKVDMLGKKLVNVSEYVSALSGQLKEMFAASGRSANFEYHIAIDGLDIKARHGSEKSVDLATQTETYLDTLFSDSVLYGHSHRGGTAATNIYDIETVLSSYRDGVAIPVHFVVGKDAITTIDFTGLSKDVADQLMQEISATNSNKNAPVRNEVINKIAEKFTGKSEALKTWSVDQFDDLAKYIYDVSSAASSALTPIEKFQAVLDNMFGKGKVDASKHESLLSGLNQDNAKNIFNQIASIEKLQPIKTTDMLTMGQVNAEIDESIAKYKTLREEANLSYSDIRNEVDKVIEHYNAGGSATSGLDFFQQYFPEGEWQKVRDLLTDAYDNVISLEEVTNRIASEFGVDPDTFAQIPNAYQDSQIDQAKAKVESFLALAEEIKNTSFYEFGNARDNVKIGEYTERLNQATNELEEFGRQNLLTAEQVESVRAALQSASSYLEDETKSYDDFYSHHYEYSNGYDAYSSDVSAAEYAAEEAQKRAEEAEQEAEAYKRASSNLAEDKFELKTENESLRAQLAQKEMSDDELEVLRQENGALEEKLELLQNIAEQYANTVTPKNREKYEELNQKDMDSGLTAKQEERFWELGEAIDLADQQLEEFGETYDKIILKLSNGKKIEILPDDAGLRKFDKIANEYYGGEYNGHEIDDVIFVRKQEQTVIEENNQELREQLDIQEQIHQKSVKSTNGNKQTAVSDDVKYLETLLEKLIEVKAAVDTKTQAFEEERVTVDGVVDAEVTSLQSLINQLQEVIAQVNLVGDAFSNINTNIPKIEVGSQLVEQNSTPTENVHYVTDPQGRPVTMYRGIRNSYSGLVSNRYHGGTFSTDNLELAKEYAGDLGKVEKVLLSMKNPLEIDGHGAFWNKIEYIGDNADEASQKLYELNASIRATEKLLKDAEQIPVSDQELKNISRGLISEDDTKRAREISYWAKELEQYKAEKAAILADDSNPYGRKNTNELVEIAKEKGYDGVIFKDIIDSATGDVKDLSTVMVTFEQDQIHYLETISSTFESSVVAFKNHFGDLTQHISASSEEVESSIRKMVELRGKVNTGEISEDEYRAFISENTIARDYKKLAKRSMAVPDFITGALDGEEFDLKHVIQMINDMLDNMRHRAQKIAKAFGKEGVPFDELLKVGGVEDISTVVTKADQASVTGDVADEVTQLERLQAVLVEVKNAVLAKTKAFYDEGNVVGQVVGKEVVALNKLLETINEIVPKVDALSTKMASVGPIDFTVKNDDSNTGATESSTTAEDKFKARVSAKKGAMTKYIDELKGVQYVTDDTREKLIGLRDALDTVKTPKDLNNIIAKFEELQTEISILKASFEKTGLNDVRDAERKLLGSFNTLNSDQRDILRKDRDNVIQQLKTYENAVLSGQRVEISAIENTTRALREQIEMYQAANKEAKKTGTSTSGNASFGSTASINATAKYNSLTRVATSDQFAGSSVVAEHLEQYKKAYDNLILARDELRSKNAIDESDREAFRTLTTECNNCAKALDKVLQNTLKLKSNKANSHDHMLGEDFVDNKQGRIDALTDFAKQMYGVNVAATDFKDNWNKVVFAVDNGDGTFTQMTATFTDARNEIVAMAGDTKKVQSALSSFLDGFKGRVRSLAQYFLATISIYDVWRVIKQGIQHVKEIDSALTELKKVTDETETSYKRFLQIASKTASEIGSTVAEFVNATADFARLGYNMEQAAELAKAASVYKNVGDGINDISQASESIISTMKAFGIEAKDAMGIVDRFNEVGNSFAISSTGIGEAMQRSASALYEAGNTIDESIALITGANSVVICATSL